MEARKVQEVRQIQPAHRKCECSPSSWNQADWCSKKMNTKKKIAVEFV
ncbi:MAG: hypothetical protein ACLU5G_01820 [Blautia sp.]